MTTRFLGVESARSTTSPALEWLWQYLLQDVASPRILDCGLVRRSTVGVLLERGAKLYMADLISPLQQKKDYWDYSGKSPVFQTDRFLAQLPLIPRCSLNAVLCWQLLDLLPPEVLAPVILQMYLYLQPGGVLFCVLREPWLPGGANWTWWLEGLTRLHRENGRATPFCYAPITNREMERLIPGGKVKTFLTRSGLREVLAFK
jgi:hypothetical protein